MSNIEAADHMLELALQHIEKSFTASEFELGMFRVQQASALALLVIAEQLTRLTNLQLTVARHNKEEGR